MRAAGSNPLLSHRWGIGPAADRVWAQITGIAPSTEPWKRLFMVLRAFIDDSYTANGVFVLGGYIATAEAWAKFSSEWEPLLPTTVRGKSGRYRFKMSEMVQRYPDRIAPFAKIIEDNVLASIWCKIDISELERAKQRIWSDRLEMFWSAPSQPFWFCFSALLGMFHEHRTTDPKVMELLPLNEKVDFYFDKRAARDATEVAEDWDEFAVGQAESIKALYGTVPRFEDDEEFLPLQAADYWAWWVRNIYEGNKDRLRNLGDLIFQKDKPSRSITALGYTFTEDQLVDSLIRKIRSGNYGVGPDIPIYDAKHSPRPETNSVKTLTSRQRGKLRRFLKKNGSPS